MDTASKIIIIFIPILAYVSSWYWSNRLIKSRIKSKTGRKQYKRYFNKGLAAVFAPFILFTGLLLFVLTKELPTGKLGLTNFILKWVLLLTQILVAYFASIRLRYDVKDLKTLSEEELIKSITD